MRKTIDIKITDAGRDKGKVFRLTEMPPRRSEAWACRALLALGKNGMYVSDELLADAANSGMAGLHALVARSGLAALMRADFSDIEPLMDEMLTCVETVEKAATRPLTEDDVEEIATLLHLRKEVLKLHWDFSTAVDH